MWSETSCCGATVNGKESLQGDRACGEAVGPRAVQCREDTPVQQLNGQREPPPKGGCCEVAHVTESKVADEQGSMVQCLGVLLHQQCCKEEAWQHGGRGRQVGSQLLLSMNHVAQDGQCRGELNLWVRCACRCITTAANSAHVMVIATVTQLTNFFESFLCCATSSTTANTSPKRPSASANLWRE